MTEAVVRHVQPAGGETGTRLEVTPASVGWRYLSFRVVALEAGETMDPTLPTEELVVVPLAGSGRFRFDDPGQMKRRGPTCAERDGGDCGGDGERHHQREQRRGAAVGPEAPGRGGRSPGRVPTHSWYTEPSR